MCRHLDGKIFDRKDAKVGITMPPFHCYCRTTTVPYYDWLDDEDDTRVSRDENGKMAFVEGDLTYQEWYNKYVKEKVTPSYSHGWSTDTRGIIQVTHDKSNEKHYKTITQSDELKNAVILRTTKTGQRNYTLYDDKGFNILEVHLGNHGSAKNHPYKPKGYHIHISNWNDGKYKGSLSNVGVTSTMHPYWHQLHVCNWCHFLHLI